LRTCEQAGIETSAEIQGAARKVLDENKKLRSLLLAHGVSGAEIVAALGGPADNSVEQVSSVPALTTVLERRITSSMVSSTSSPSPHHSRAASVPQHLPPVLSLKTPSSRPVALSSRESLSPTSIASSMGTPPALYQAPVYTASIAPQGPEIKAEDVQYDYLYEQHQPWPYSQAYTHTSNPAAYYSTSSCVDADNVIGTIRTDTNSVYHTDRSCAHLAQPYHNNNNNNNTNNYVIYPVTTTCSQQYSTL
jgi:hypothetical protein